MSLLCQSSELSNIKNKKHVSLDEEESIFISLFLNDEIESFFRYSYACPVEIFLALRLLRHSSVMFLLKFIQNQIQKLRYRM